MKAQNNKEINRSYLQFSLCLAATVFVGVLIFYSYMKTSKIEVDRIVDKTEEYDNIYVQQMDLANRIDSIYQYTTLFNTNKNDALLHKSVSKRKQEMISLMDDMNSRDVKLYQKLISEVNTFMSSKDSIRILKTEEDLVRSDLKKCKEDNKQTNRKLTIGGITINK